MSKLFQTPVSLNILYDLLDQICLFKETYYVIDPTSFNKMMYIGLYQQFIDTITPHYFPQKRSAVLKEPTYYNFINIIKQISKLHGIEVKSKIVRMNSTKHTSYFLDHKTG